jgi:preprotein translocase subunit SecA
MDPSVRVPAYAADITYGTNSEFGFDYLRDNMCVRPEDRVQRGHAYAVVDEVDSILIDEARTPLIISGAGTKSSEVYKQFAKVIPRLKQEVDFELDEAKRTVAPTESGNHKVSRLSASDICMTIDRWLILQQALKAEFSSRKDVDYVVKDGEVLIVDSYRRLVLMARLPEGLHQAIEAKERARPRREPDARDHHAAELLPNV